MHDGKEEGKEPAKKKFPIRKLTSNSIRPGGIPRGPVKTGMAVMSITETKNESEEDIKIKPIKIDASKIRLLGGDKLKLKSELEARQKTNMDH